MGGDAHRPGGGVLILQGIPQAAQAFQHIAVGIGQRLPVFPGNGLSALCAPHRQRRAHQQITRQQRQRGQDVPVRGKGGHARRPEHGDAHRRDGVGVEHFQRLNVGGDQGDQVAPVTPFQLCGGQAAQRAEHLIPDKCQQPEGDIVVGRLLRIAQHAAQQGKHQNAPEGCAHGGQRALQPGSGQDGKAAENGDEGSAEVPRHAHNDGCHHDGQHGLYQHDQPRHNGGGGAVVRCFMHQASSFARVSSCFWAVYRRQ